MSQPDTAFEAAFALGASRHAEVLAWLRTGPVVADPVAGALARLALGEASQSATVAAALYQGGVSERRRVAQALGYMEQARPRLLLYESLEDRDAEVRLEAGRVHARLGSRRARRALEEIFQSGPRRLRAEAARILFDAGTRFDPESFSRLPRDLRGAAMARYAYAMPKTGFRTMRGQLRARDRTLRAGVAAAVVARQEMTVRQLTRWIRRAGAGPARMARVLAGDRSASKALARLTPMQIPQALEVVAALRGLPDTAARLDPNIARTVAGQVGQWIEADGVVADLQARVVYSVAETEPEAGRTVARARIDGAGGPGLVAAARVLSELGDKQDVRPLLDRASRAEADPERASLLAAAGQLCAR